MPQLSTNRSEFHLNHLYLARRISRYALDLFLKIFQFFGGQGSFGKPLEQAEVQALYSRAIDPWFNLQAGVRQDFGGKTTPKPMIFNDLRFFQPTAVRHCSVRMTDGNPLRGVSQQAIPADHGWAGSADPTGTPRGDTTYGRQRRLVFVVVAAGGESPTSFMNLVVSVAR